MSNLTDAGAAGLFRAVGLQPDGPAVLGRPMRASGPGVYIVELPEALGAPPIDIARIGKWIEQVDTLRLDGARPTARELAARLTSFWLPSRRVLYIGAAESSIASRVAALDRHVLGERRPHAASHWLKTLRVPAFRVWWAPTRAVEEYEDALMTAFGESVPPEEAARLPDPAVILPWANLRSASGPAKPHGIAGSVPPAEPVAAAPPSRVVEVEPGDADGARPDARGTGTARRAPTGAGPAGAPRRAAPRRAPAPADQPTSREPAPRRTTSAKPRAGRAAEPVLLSFDGLARLRQEHETLLARRPEIVARIRTAKELGDLKENSDYTSAREEQSFLEGRIQAIEAQLRAAVVVGAEAGGDRVGIGTTLTVELDGEPRRITIVGTTESDPSAGRISHASPVGRALVGRSAGDDVVVTTPGGEVVYRIVGIE